MRLLFLGRVGRRKLGGIARTSKLVRENLEALGWSVTLGDCLAPPSKIDADIVWVYGEPDKVPLILEKAADVPVVVNMPLTGSTHSINKAVRLFSSWKHPNIYMGVFTHSSASAHPRMIALPKQIRKPSESVPYQERSGIFLGDLTKSTSPGLLGNFDVLGFCSMLKSRLPGVPLVFVDQYSDHRTKPPKICDVIPYDHALMDTLSKHRVMCSVVASETFAMVPAEAQACGTPTIFRHMPQSLTEYFGHSAPCARDEKDMADWAEWLYKDEGEWSRWSNAGILNAKSYNGAQALSSILKKVARHG